MTDTAARLRALAERLNTTRVTHHQVSRDWEPYETATKTHPVEHIKAEAADAILALLDALDEARRERDEAVRIVGDMTTRCVDAEIKRDAAVALLRECRELVSPPLSGTERRLADRLDALLGGGEGV